jgi:DNA repair exonuclease SbcCD ATPase subunit
MSNDDEQEFAATTYISHSHSIDSDDDVSQHERDTQEIEALQHEIAELEQQLQNYQAETNERLDKLEHSPQHHISPEERAFRILEDV